MGSFLSTPVQAPSTSTFLTDQKAQQDQINQQQAQLDKKREDIMQQSASDLSARRRGILGKSLLDSQSADGTQPSKNSLLG